MRYRIISFLKGVKRKRRLRSIFPRSKTNFISNTLTVGKYININIPEKSAKIIIKENVHFNEFCNLLVFGGSKLTIGKNVFFNNYCSINCLDEIEIGSDTMFGESVKLYDHNHAHSENIKQGEYTTAPIIIGKNCWIGSNVTILKGVTIGDNVIIGAHNLIFKSVAGNTIVKSQQSYIFERFNEL